MKFVLAACDLLQMIHRSSFVGRDSTVRIIMILYEHTMVGELELDAHENSDFAFSRKQNRFFVGLSVRRRVRRQSRTHSNIHVFVFGRSTTRSIFFFNMCGENQEEPEDDSISVYPVLSCVRFTVFFVHPDALTLVID